MNKLVIIGNGFDLAHGLKTSYKDFILWHINKVFYQHGKNKESNLIKIDSNLPYSKISTIDDLKRYKGYNDNISRFKIEGKYDFVNHILKNIETYNWVDIEKEYYDRLIEIYKPFEKYESYETKDLNNLNKSLYLISTDLQEYLLSNVSGKAKRNHEIYELFYEIGNSENYLNFDINKTTMMVLNFNYTDTFQLYFDKQTFPQHVGNYIHGKLDDSKNHIIFGYGDETDEYYEKLENLKDNEFLKHMKSFAYLQTPNYKDLFKFLDQDHLEEDKREKFDVYIMGHSCDVSDRLLFTHIFEHPLMNSVKLYYYERPDGTNDFFEKTQELSRHFRKDAKHKMRKCIVPFSESKPLPQSKPQN